MSSRKRGRNKQQQQRLTLEPVAGTTAGPSSSSLGIGSSSARVRFSSPNGKGSSPSGPSARAGKMGRTKKPKQQTLEASLGKGKTKSPKQQPSTENSDGLLPFSIGNDVQIRQRIAPSPPPSSFMPKSKSGGHRVVVDSDSETPVEEDAGVDDSDGEHPLKQETPQHRRGTQAVTILSDSSSSQDSDEDEESRDNAPSSQPLPNQTAGDDSSDDDQPLATPRSSMPRYRARQVITVDNSEDEDSEDDIQGPAKRRRLANKKADPVNSGSTSDGSGSSRATSKGSSKLQERDSPPPSSAVRSTRSGVRKRHRTDKEKRMELLRRRRAGEKDLTMEDLESSSDEEEEQGALYDTDSELEVLDVFEDESESGQEQEQEQEAPSTRKGKKKAKKEKKKKETVAKASSPNPLDNDENTDDEDFIDDEDDTLGVPDEALAQIPLEFTMASRKPLKAHFKDAIECLVHRKINPAFEKDNEVYVTAWRRLSDEVTGLANSKFVSSVWRPDFYKALRARPYITQQELGTGALATQFENCQACGRSGHPATWSISFQGKPYDSKTLDEVESDSEDEDESGDRDAEGNSIPPEDKEFYVGQTCNSNAGTAHNLIHWKPALRDWVDSRLEVEHWLDPAKIVQREKMKPKKRHKLADQIVEEWDGNNVIKGLFMDFKQNIETARNADPTKVARGARRYMA